MDNKEYFKKNENNLKEKLLNIEKEQKKQDEIERKKNEIFTKNIDTLKNNFLDKSQRLKTLKNYHNERQKSWQKHPEPFYCNLLIFVFALFTIVGIILLFNNKYYKELLNMNIICCLMNIFRLIYLLKKWNSMIKNIENCETQTKLLQDIIKNFIEYQCSNPNYNNELFNTVNKYFKSYNEKADIFEKNYNSWFKTNNSLNYAPRGYFKEFHITSLGICSLLITLNILANIL